MDSNETISRWADAHRQRLNLTQTDIGKILGVSQPQARARLRGYMPFTSNELEILSKKFGEAAPLNFPEQSGSNKKVDYIPEYDIRASAGGGSMSSEENIITNWPFSPEYIQNELRTSPEHLALIEVKGDSMEPTLSSGDRIMVNMADVNISQPGIFVIFDGDGTVIKRLERVYTSEEPTVALISDNEKHTRYEVLLNDRIKVVGRVIWAGKKM